ncbi:hypothetical protein GOB98_22860 [Sinorhizobium meliloti]|nr:hypothetical protein [Sinorhizobium meliloti]MDW9978883.1 hypothetical protein [Sinorhizobium meliloti]MDX0295507.1 hypothetical protein [Sinorhizobium meliloti]
MPKNAPPPRMGIEKFLFDHEFAIRECLKGFHPTNTFSFQGVLVRQRGMLRRLRKVRRVVDPNVAHRAWNTVDRHRASAACAIEQIRARAWGLGELNNSLTSTFVNLQHVTFADTADRRRSGELHRFNLEGYKRKVRRALAQLHRSYPDMWAVGIVEISAARTSAETLSFEPHCHVLIDGVPKEAVRAAFKNLLGKRSSGLKPVRLQDVPTRADLSRVLGYFLKQVPELRTNLLGEDGRLKKGRANLLTGSSEIEWLAWMAAHRVTDLLIATGPPAKTIRDFEYRELQPIIEELIRPRPEPRP